VAAPLTEIAVVQVTSEGTAVTQAGFGYGLVLSANAAFAERVRSYASLTEGAVDFATTTVEYQAIAEHFAQSPRPTKVYVGRRANKPTMRWAVTPVVGNTTTYKLKFRSAAQTSYTEAEYVSDGTATMAEIIAGLKADIDAAGLALTVSDQTTFMRIVANTAGDWFAFESTTSPIENLKVVQDHADPGLAADLDAIFLENSEWYAVHSLYNSTAEVTAIASWVQSNERAFIAQSQETSIISVSSGSDTTSIAYVLKNAGRTRTMLMYHENNAAFLDTAISGRCLPEDPGTETWAHKPLTLTEGASTLTSTHITNLKAKNCGYFTTIGGVNATFEGKVSSGSYMDVIRLNDETVARMQEALVTLATSSTKIPYTQEGIFAVAAQVKGVLERAERKGAIAAGWKVTVPNIADVPTADKTSRTLNNVKFDYTVTGAIQKMTVSGVARV